jgi:hypothetical protein
LAPCHLAKQSDPDTHHSLCQQEANYVRVTATIRSLGVRPKPNSHSNPYAAAPCFCVAKIVRKDLEQYDPGDAGALRAGFSLTLGLVEELQLLERSLLQELRDIGDVGKACFLQEHEEGEEGDDDDHELHDVKAKKKAKHGQ